MKIATWNVNSIRTRLEQIVDWLRQNSVDVLCLQSKVVDAEFPRNWESPLLIGAEALVMGIRRWRLALGLLDTK